MAKVVGLQTLILSTVINQNKGTMQTTKEIKTVKDLRQEGHKVRVFHTRKNNCWGMTGLGANPRGGSTTVEVTIKGNSIEKDLTVRGEARCSNMDNYNKKVGVSIALGRALSAFQKMSKEL